MPTYIIERDIPGASKLSTDELKDISQKSNDTIAGLRSQYKWVTSYVAGDKFYCVHEAESADAVQRHSREGGFPITSITEIAAVIGPASVVRAG